MVKKFAPIAAAAFGFIAVVMIFFASTYVVVMGEKVSYTGFQVVFGYTEVSEYAGTEISQKVFGFSFMNLLPYLFAAAGVACGVLAFMKEDKRKVLSLAGILLFAVAALLFFMVIGGIQIAIPENMPEKMVKSYVEGWKENLELGIGAIVAGVCSIFAAGCSAVSVVSK